LYIGFDILSDIFNVVHYSNWYELAIPRRKIRLIGNAKCRHLKELICKGTLRQVFIYLMPRIPFPPLDTVYVYTVYLFTQRKGEGGELNQTEGERGNSSHSGVENTNSL
jgi:hypothetical protein